MALYLGSNRVTIVSDGTYDAQVPDFQNVKAPYQENMWCNNGTMASVTNSIWIEPRAFVKGDVVRIRGINFTSNYPGKARIDMFYKSDGSYKGVAGNMASLISASTTGSDYNSAGTYVWDNSTSTLTFTFNGSNASSFCNTYTYAFGGQYATGYDANSVIMTVNEEITHHSESSHTNRSVNLGGTKY